MRLDRCVCVSKMYVLDGSGMLRNGILAVSSKTLQIGSTKLH